MGERVNNFFKGTAMTLTGAALWYVSDYISLENVPAMQEGVRMGLEEAANCTCLIGGTVLGLGGLWKMYKNRKLTQDIPDEDLYHPPKQIIYKHIV